MFILHSKVSYAPGALGAIADTVSALIEATRAEPGCVEYDLISDLREPDTILAIEVWQSHHAFAAHLASSHFREFVSRMPAPVAHERRVYEGAEADVAALRG